MIDIVLQQNTEIWKWITGDWKGALWDHLLGLIGEPATGVIIGGSLMLSFYIAGDGDIAAPSVATMLLAGIMVPILPGDARSSAYIIAFFGLVGAVVAVGRTYMLEGGGY